MRKRNAAITWAVGMVLMVPVIEWVSPASGRVRSQEVARVVSPGMVRVSQVGYLPGESKRVVIVGGGGGQGEVRAVKGGRVVLTVAVPEGKLDPDSGDVTSVADLSALREPGEYVLEFTGKDGKTGRSDVIYIGREVYDRGLRLAIRAFTGQRCGTAVSLAPDFPEYKYPACHTGPARFHESTGKTGETACTKGWHDAGDYNRYIVNSGITMGTLLHAWEMFQLRLGGLRLDLPESGGVLPDYLAEVKWNLDWMLQMQDLADGGVYHKATAANFCGMVMPQEDKSEMLIVGSGKAPYKTTQATADFAAVCAMAARVYQPYDPEYAARCLAAARKAYDWAVAHPASLFVDNPHGIQTGGYGDPHPEDELLWMSAELFRTTGEERYHQYFLDHYKRFSPPIPPVGPQNWGGVQNMAFYAYLLGGKGREEVKETVRTSLIAAAAACVKRAGANGYLLPMEENDYVWGSNAVVANYGVMLHMANRVSPGARYLEAAQNCLHYLLGRNTFGLSFVTQVGVRWPMHPHHRPSAADGIAQPWPGMLVGGPNKDNGKKPVARQWFDEEGDYRTNEIAINWNAPLVFLLAGATESGR